MSSELKFLKHNQHNQHNQPEEKSSNSNVNVTELISRLNEEKKRERNSNLALSVAAVSAVTVFGIIISL